MADGDRQQNEDMGARASGEPEAVLMGRNRERVDLLDFMQNPPGIVPDHHKKFLDDLVDQVRQGAHRGWGQRLYDDAWSDEDIEAERNDT